MTASSSKKPKILVVFDFDNTLVEASCDRYTFDIITDSKRTAKGRMYPSKTMWDMPPISRSLQERGGRGVRLNDLIRCLDDIQFVNGMRDLMVELAKRGHEVIIISDCNSVFIGHTLIRAGVQDCVTDIFTNPAWFDEKDRLHLSEYHHQDWCELCPPNMCKGRVLTNYLRKRFAEGEKFLFVAYVGDGRNDFCPSLCLGDQDLIFPRLGYDLFRTIHAEGCTRDRKFSIKGKVVPWETGNMVKLRLLEEIRRYK